MQSGNRADRPELSEALRRAKLTGQPSWSPSSTASPTQCRASPLYRTAARGSSPRTCRRLVNSPSTFSPPFLRQSARLSYAHERGLGAAKARGVKLGNPNGAAPLRRAGKGKQAAVSARRAAVDSRTKELVGEAARLKACGASALRQSAEGLNRERIEAPRGGAWHPSGVKRLLDRAARLGAE